MSVYVLFPPRMELFFAFFLAPFSRRYYSMVWFCDFLVFWGGGGGACSRLVGKWLFFIFLDPCGLEDGVVEEERKKREKGKKTPSLNAADRESVKWRK